MVRVVGERGERCEQEDGPRGLYTPIKFFLSTRPLPSPSPARKTRDIVLTGTRKTAASSDQAYVRLVSTFAVIEVGRELGGECDERRSRGRRARESPLEISLPSQTRDDPRFPRIFFVCVPSSGSRSREGKYIARCIEDEGWEESRRKNKRGVCAHALSLSLFFPLLR